MNLLDFRMEDKASKIQLAKQKHNESLLALVTKKVSKRVDKKQKTPLHVSMPNSS